MVGGTISVSSPNAVTSFITSSNTVVPTYSSRITKVVNKKTIEVQKPFGVYDSGSGFYRIAAIGSGSYQINWPKFHEYDTSSINFKSFADIRLEKLRTFSGDINRVAAYVKNNGPFSNWQKVIDTPVESPELLLDPTSLTGTTRIGYFNSDSVINTYWEASGGQYGTETSATVQTFSDNEYLSDSVFVSASAASMLDDDSNEWLKLQLKPQYSMSFIEDTEYSITAKLFCDNTNGAQNTTKAVFHMSGSAFGMSPSLSDSGYGRAIAKVQFDSIAGKTEQKDLAATFVPDSSGKAVLQVRFTGGHWHMSQISIKPNSDTNFSPEFIRLIAPVPPLQTRPDTLDFAFEFYDINNNKAKTVLTTIPDSPDGVEFAGENMNILGDDNMIGGSLYIGGDSVGAGIQFGGVNSTLPETGESAAEGSGFIRSVKYQGFTSASDASADATGFLIYSGSVLPDSGDDYKGVGLELVGQSGSLRFSTIPSRFEVVADAFFVGSTNTQFISGSGGIIEISSSAFHLSSSGDVVISGSVTATEGNIAGWKIVDNKLSGSNATLDALGSALYKSDQGPDTNPNDGYYIDFTPSDSNPYFVRFGSNFAVNNQGILVASGALIEGQLTASTGKIAEWNIGSNTISKATDNTFTGLSSAGDS